MRSPIIGCSCINSFSPSSSGPGLCRTESGTPNRPDVVQECSLLDIGDLFLRKFHPPGYGYRQPDHGLGVAARVAVLGLEDCEQRA